MKNLKYIATVGLVATTLLTACSNDQHESKKDEVKTVETKKEVKKEKNKYPDHIKAKSGDKLSYNDTTVQYNQKAYIGEDKIPENLKAYIKNAPESVYNENNRLMAATEINFSITNNSKEELYLSGFKPALNNSQPSVEFRHVRVTEPNEEIVTETKLKPGETKKYKEVYYAVVPKENFDKITINKNFNKNDFTINYDINDDLVEDKDPNSLYYYVTQELKDNDFIK